jgi:copper chaperone
VATTILHVEGMACDHCVKAVTKAVTALHGVNGVQVNLQGKTVTVEHDPAGATFAQLKEAVEDQGYDVVA